MIPKSQTLTHFIFSDAQPGQAFTDLKEVGLTKKMDVKVPKDNNPNYLTDMVVITSNNILIVDGWNNSVKLMDVQTGCQLSHVQLPGRPWRLCLLPGDRAAVSLPSEKAIQKIDVSADQLKLLDSVHVEGECKCLAYMNNTFIVDFRGQHCVATLNMEGQLLKSVTKDNMGNELFKNPYYICVTAEKNASSIYVSDIDTRTITQLNEELDLLKTFKAPNVVVPGVLATAGGGQLLVRAWGPDNHRLWVLDTSTGVFTELSVGLLGEEGSRAKEGCVAFCSRLGRLHVNIGNENEVIRLYELS